MSRRSRASCPTYCLRQGSSRKALRLLLAVVHRPKQQGSGRHRFGEQVALQFVAAQSHSSRCWRSFSTPSATTFRPRACARSTTASTTARASALISRSSTKLRSIFSSLGRQLAQVGQARIAGAEVVDRQMCTPTAPSSRKMRLVAFGVFHRHRFGDLAGQQRRVDLVALQRRGDVRRGPLGASGAADRLIATRMRRPRRARPRACRQASSMTHARAADQAVALGDRDEHAGLTMPRSGAASASALRPR